MTRKIIYISIITLILNLGVANAGSTGSENLKTNSSQNSANECFEGLSRAMFKFNYALDGALFEPVARGYRSLPVGIRKGTGNVVNNLRSLLTLSNNILQGDFANAGNTAGRFAVNSTVGILGIFDPASHLGLKDSGKEDFGQTIGSWGTNSGCYFVLPILGPTTARDAVGLVGNMFLDPVYQITHNTEVADRSFSEHNFWYYRSTGAVDFRAKNIESFDSIEENSIDLYASVKSLYLQDRNKKISNSKSSTATQNDDGWEEIDTE
jgi:phospholipid-binding lipoprotein MlaA